MSKIKGFTIFEVVVAIVLLGIAISATIFSLTAARMYSMSAKHHYEASNIARDEIEYIIATHDMSMSPSSVTLDGQLYNVNPVLYGGNDYVDVTVSWTEKMWVDVVTSEKIVLRLNW